MKNIFKLSTILLASFSLFSCGETDNTTTFDLYINKYNDGKLVEEIEKTSTDDTYVYKMVFLARNHTGKAVIIPTSELNLKIGDKEYKPVFFALTWKMISNSDGKSSYYVDTSTETAQIESKENELLNVFPCFEVDPTGKEYTIEYKGSALKHFGE